MTLLTAACQAMANGDYIEDIMLRPTLDFQLVLRYESLTRRLGVFSYSFTVVLEAIEGDFARQ